MHCKPRYKRKVVDEGGIFPAEHQGLPEFLSHWKTRERQEVFFLQEVRIGVDVEEAFVDRGFERCPIVVGQYKNLSTACSRKWRLRW